ncbi:MAG: ribosomal protein [Solirubrobacterales bacterium]|nr:ribosomal protein [Solirubrobacterales bacterium]
MATTKTTKLTIASRPTGSSRATRRLRREGRVPGILYGGGVEPLAFQVDARELRHALAAAGAVVELSLEDKTTSAVLKDAQRDAVRGDTLHVDFVRVDLNQAIQSIVPVVLLGEEDAPGVKEGGVLEHITREVTVEALPNEIPESLTYDVSEMQINDTVTLSQITPPEGVTLVDDVDETVIATLTPPRLQLEDEEGIEEETERVGESAAGERAGDEAGGAGDASSE